MKRITVLLVLTLLLTSCKGVGHIRDADADTEVYYKREINYRYLDDVYDWFKEVKSTVEARAHNDGIKGEPYLIDDWSFIDEEEVHIFVQVDHYIYRVVLDKVTDDLYIEFVGTEGIE